MAADLFRLVWAILTFAIAVLLNEWLSGRVHAIVSQWLGS